MNVLGKIKKRTKHFSIPLEKEVIKIDKNGNEIVITISYKIKFIDSARDMANSLSYLADNLAEEIHKNNFKNCNCFPEYKGVKDNSIKYKCLSCNKDFLRLMKN